MDSEIHWDLHKQWQTQWIENKTHPMNSFVLELNIDQQCKFDPNTEQQSWCIYQYWTIEQNSKSVFQIFEKKIIRMHREKLNIM